jgi:hypothetical protein
LASFSVPAILEQVLNLLDVLLHLFNSFNRYDLNWQYQTFYHQTKTVF